MKPRELTVPEKHQLKIARDTLKMSDVGARIMGGMTKKEAREVIKKLTGKEPKEESVKEGMSKAQVLMNLMEESDLRGPQPSRQSSDGKEIFFDKDDKLYIKSKKSDPGKGLSYEAQDVTASESGRSGGWDVYDGTNSNGNEISFYGFSVIKKY